MTRWELPSRPDFDHWLESILTGLGFNFERMSLKSLPSNVHWHIRRPGSKGVLEATWVHQGEAWLSVHSNRDAEWIPPLVEVILSS